MRNARSRYRWVVALPLLAGCAGKTLSAGGGATNDAGGGATSDAGAMFDAGTAGEAIELEIVEVLAPTTPVNGACSYTADPNQPTLSRGTADLEFASLVAYQPELLIESLEPASQSETNRIVVHSATTKITDETGVDVVSLLARMCSGEATGTKDVAACATGEQLGKGLTTPVVPFTTSLGSSVAPTQTYAPSYAALGVTLLDEATVGLLRSYFSNAIEVDGTDAFTTTFHLLTYTVLQGESLGGVAVASNEYELPVTVTFGGLVTNVKGDTDSVLGRCLDTAAVPTTAQACVLGQDTPVAASSIEDSNIPACPAPDAG